MKVERKKIEPAFEPIVITLETREEAEEMNAIMNHVCINKENGPLYGLYRALENMNLSYEERFKELDTRLKEVYSELS